MQRFGTAKELAMLVLWLASDRASFTPVSCYNVDGGNLALKAQSLCTPVVGYLDRTWPPILFLLKV